MDELITGLILAGGMSRRFGSDKALFVVEGKTMIRRVYDAMAPVAAPIFVSVDSVVRRYDIPARHIADGIPGLGPLGGLHAGMLAADAEWLLTAPCDMPHLQTDTFAALLAARTSRCDAVIAVSEDDRLQPVLGCFNRRCLGILDRHLKSPDRSMHAFVRSLSAMTVRFEASTLRNVNRASDV